MYSANYYYFFFFLITLAVSHRGCDMREGCIQGLHMTLFSMEKHIYFPYMHSQHCYNFF